MILKLVAKLGEKSGVEPDYASGQLVCTLSKDLNPAQLYSLLEENISSFEKLEFDLESFYSLKFDCLNKEDIELVLYSIHSFFCVTPFSLKSKNKSKEWIIPELSSDSNLSHLLKAHQFARRLQETPPNLLNTAEFVKEIKDLFKPFKDLVVIREIEGENLEKEKLNLIRAVGQASQNKPRLLILEYIPSPGKDVVALVGKGICYDTGGLSIKTGSYMSDMKFDMSGAAISASTLFALASSKSKKNVVVLLPLAENSISGNSYRPDDVIVSRSGLSVEIDNTDAEGRLVLADAIAYACSLYNPSELITIATLTGAIGYALGYKYAGAWFTSCASFKSFEAAANKAGEWFWRMPLDDYYLKSLKSSRVADIKNSAKTGAGGASRAACFLKEFSSSESFVHLDIANVAHSENGTVSRAPLLRTLYFYLFN